MTTTQTAAESLAALIEAAPPELREALTQCPNEGWHRQHPGPEPCGVCGFGDYERISLPVPEATLAAMQWVLATPRDGIIDMITDEVLVLWKDVPEGLHGRGNDIFAAIRAALEA